MASRIQGSDIVSNGSRCRHYHHPIRRPEDVVDVYGFARCARCHEKNQAALEQARQQRIALQSSMDRVKVERACDGERFAWLSAAEMHLAVALLTHRGRSAAEIADILHCTNRTAQRYRNPNYRAAVLGLAA